MTLLAQMRGHLPARTRITLAEAITWLAFGHALTSPELRDFELEALRTRAAAFTASANRKATALQMRGLTEDYNRLLSIVPEDREHDELARRHEREVQDEREALWHAAERILELGRQGTLRIYGLEDGKTRVEEIPPADLELCGWKPDIDHDAVGSRVNTWRDIMVDCLQLEAQHLQAREIEPPNAEPGRQTSAGEVRAVRFLAPLLATDPHLTKDAAQQRLSEAGIPTSDNGFQHRIWPEARKSGRTASASSSRAETKREIGDPNRLAS